MGTKQGHWEVKELLDPSEDHRTSIYGGGHESVYDSGSLDYPSHGAQFSHGRERVTGPGNIETRQSYGDYRKSGNGAVYEDYDSQRIKPQSREMEYERY